MQWKYALTAAGLLSCGMAVAGAQGGAKDPRVGLKAGIKDAGQAIRNLELVSTLAKPSGFFDPQTPIGNPIPAEQPENANAGANANSGANAAGGSAAGANTAAPAEAPKPPAFDPKVANRMDFNNTDLAFDGHRMFMGNYHGFNVYDIEESKDPKILASIVCPGGQGDVSVYKNLLFMSVEQSRGRLDCGTQGHQAAVSSERFRGVRIFDITDVKKPRQVAAVQSCRGSHTHTLVPDPKDPANIYVYGSGTGPVRAGEELAGCSDKDPKEDQETALFSIDVIKVPLARPEDAKVVNRPRIFADPNSGNIAGLWMGGTHGEGTQKTSVTNQCHDITVFPEIGLAAGACSGNGILLDISDPEHPSRIDQVVDKNFAYWHSATFNNDGTKVIFTDEWGGGSRPRCRAIDPQTWGADAIFEIVDRKLTFGGYYKMPAVQTDQENCVAHNGSLIPVPGRDIMVQAWYQGGISVFDFTDAAKPQEIAFFDRGPLDAKTLFLGGYWSAYWFNGQIYASEIARGMDVFRLKPSEFLSQNEITAATLAHVDTFNPQDQKKVSWPNTAVVGRAYLDQLGRTRALPQDRANAVRSALDRADNLAPKSSRAMQSATQLETEAAQLDTVAASAQGADRKRLTALAALLRARAATLKG
ncbi:MAG: LVIVD repeat-containing protein [Vicinamibacterales bacterium]